MLICTLSNLCNLCKLLSLTGLVLKIICLARLLKTVGSIALIGACSTYHRLDSSGSLQLWLIS